jgi:hypothetical protein
VLAKFVWRYASWSFALGGSFVCVCVCVWGGSGGFLCKVQGSVLSIVMLSFFFFFLFWFLVLLFCINY